MSDVAFEPNTFSLQSGIVLPPNAQPDYAYEETLVFGDFAGSGENFYQAAAPYYDVVLSVTSNLNTSATTGSRVALLAIAQSPSTNIIQIPAPLVQPAVYNGFYTWSTGVSSAWGADDGSREIYQVMALPVVLLYPGYFLTLSARGFETGDQWLGVTMVVIHIPNGPVSPPADASLVATPLVL